KASGVTITTTGTAAVAQVLGPQRGAQCAASYAVITDRMKADMDAFKASGGQTPDATLSTTNAQAFDAQTRADEQAFHDFVGDNEYYVYMALVGEVVQVGRTLASPNGAGGR